MKRISVLFSAPRKVESIEEQMHPPGEGEVLVQTKLSAISPGSERLIFEGLAPGELPADETLPNLQGELSFPLRYGYSAVGYVRALGPGVDKTWLGQPVFAFHPHTSAFTIQTSQLIRLPDDLALADAVFLPNMETALNLVQDGAPLFGERVLVIGQGVVGLLTTLLLSQTAPDLLLTLEPVELRRSLSLEAGADHSFDPLSSADMAEIERLLKLDSETGGADLIFELSGNPQALNLAIRFAGFAGRLLIGSWYGSKQTAGLDLGAAFHRRRLTLKSSQVSTIDPELSGRWDKSRRLALVLQVLREIQPSRWVTHHFDVTEAVDAFAELDNPQAVQILLTYAHEGTQP
jgi:2-desacetyl-2-hydroxyethyl bacteriochlorophyllide A dehydrogenase